MIIPVARFLLLFTGALVVGSMFAIWAGYDPRGFSYVTFVEVHQNAVRGLNVVLPVLGLDTIVLTLLLAYLQRAWKSQLVLLLVAAGFLLIAGLLTRFGCQPINAIVLGWSVENPPSAWEVLRDRWWQFHVLRFVAGLIGYALVVVSVLRRPVTDRSIIRSGH